MHFELPGGLAFEPGTTCRPRNPRRKWLRIDISDSVSANSRECLATSTALRVFGMRILNERNEILLG